MTTYKDRKGGVWTIIDIDRRESWGADLLTLRDQDGVTKIVTRSVLRHYEKTDSDD